MQIPSTFSGMLPGPKRDAALARLSAIRASVAVSGGVNDAALSAKAPAKSGPRFRAPRLLNLGVDSSLDASRVGASGVAIGSHLR